jgi:hypothetical protein
MGDEKREQKRRGANELRALLPPGSTAFSWNGELYAPGGEGQDPDRFYNLAGAEVDLPDDFPSAEELQRSRDRASRGLSSYPGALPIQQHISKGSSGSGTSTEGAGGGEEDFDGMTKDDLVERARAAGLTVKSSGSTGEPLKEDYVRALKKTQKQRP